MADSKSIAGKRIMMFGPGTIIALAVVFFIGFYQYRQKTANSHLPPPGWGAGAGRSELPAMDLRGPVPEPAFFLNHRDALHLSAKQIKSLAALEGEWKSESAPLKEELSNQAHRLERFVEQKGRPMSANDLLGQAGSVSALSRKLASLRQEYWKRGITLLGPDQVRKADEAREREFGKLQNAKKRNQPQIHTDEHR